LCTSTTTIAPEPTCEYKCGKWCSKPLPPFNNQNDCKTAVSNCAIQLTSCFLKAGWPDSLKCFEFASWCDDVKSYCGSSCPGNNCSWNKCKSKFPPSQPQQPAPSVSTTVFPCAATTTKTTTKTTTTTTTTVVPVPTHECICEQPHNPRKGYTKDEPVAGIELPCLTCNNLERDYKSGNYFKLYNNEESSKCPSFGKPSIPNGCKKACDNQYTSCVNVYAKNCKDKEEKNKGKGRWHRDTSEVDKRTWGWGKWDKYDNDDKYDDAMDKCKSQWNDCYDVNKWKNGNGKCNDWNRGW
jgi:hypothetical protein